MLPDTNWLSTIVESADEAIVTQTLDGIVVSWNRAAERLLGYPARDMIGRPLATISPPERLHEEWTRLETLARGERVEPYETLRLRQDGQVIAVELALSPIRDADGRVIGAVTLVRDMSRHRRSQFLEDERNRWLEGMLRGLGGGVIAVDDAGRITFMNGVAEKLCGWNRQDAIGRSVDSVVWLVAEATRRRVDNPGVQALQHRETVRPAQPTLLISRDGIEYPVDVVASMIHRDDGLVLGAIVVLQDTTEARRAGHALARLAAIVESSDDAIVSKTLDGIVISWNTGAERLFGYTAADMVGRPITTIFPPDLLAEETDFLARLAKGERIEHYETVRRRKDGREIDISVTLSPIFDANHRVIGVSKIARDISETKRRERDQAELLRKEQLALKESMAANRMKDEFLATLSHELRTPVNSILGWSQLLHDQQLDPDGARRAIEVIVRNARLQSHLIDQLLDISRSMVGKIKLDIRPTDFGMVVRDALESIRPSMAIKELRLLTRLGDQPVMILGDAHRIQQVVWNLLTNAVKFTPAGGQIEVVLEPHVGFAHLVVHDTGVGIPPELLPVVFDRFRQVDGSTTRAYTGLGLGLAIVRQLVELHGGSVWAESAGVGSGARFTVELPLLSGDGHGIPAVVQDSLTEEQDRPDLLDVRVLLVEDDIDSREALARLLTSVGARVREAESADAALQAAQDSDFDVLVSDIAMPGVDGYALMQTLRQRAPSLVGIALTAYNGHEDRERAFRAGFSAHLGKPVSTTDLVRSIADAARTRNEQATARRWGKTGLSGLGGEQERPS